MNDTDDTKAITKVRLENKKQTVHVFTTAVLQIGFVVIKNIENL